MFYSLLLEDYGEYPRTIILSTHLVEEVTHIIEDVIIIKEGRLVVQSSVEALLQQGHIISGKKIKWMIFQAIKSNKPRSLWK